MKRVCRSRGSVAVLVGVAGCALVLGVTGCRRSSGMSGAPARASAASVVPARAGSTYALMQMNLCLSGLAGCYGKVAYPDGVQEAVARIRDVRPDAVTLNEACRRDASGIARRTGYHLRFSRVVYRGAPLACVQPGGRGLFGDAVLTKAAVEHTDTEAFQAQAGIERRRWLCVTTALDIDVCTAHLNTRVGIEVAGNDPQCAELRAVLARHAAARTVIFGGDLNRRPSCAPDGFWTRTDSSAVQAPGLQHAYGSSGLRSPSVEILPATHTDHDVLLVRAAIAAER